jgi:agmatinase
MKTTKKFLSCDSTFADADIVLFGVPYDATSTYRRGSALGPQKMREDSEEAIEKYSPYQNKSLKEIKVHDAGDINITSEDPAPMVYSTEAKATEILDANKFPFMLGGEHLVTLGAVRAVAKKYPSFVIIHFDAHADLREDFDGQVLNHATVVRRCFDIVGKGNIFQFGIRSGTRCEFEFAAENTQLTRCNFNNLDKAIKAIGNRPVYLTVDLDVLDPSEFPGTGTPEAGGVSFSQLFAATQDIFRSLNVVAADINEFSPACDPNGISTALACKYLRETLLMIRK